MRRDEANRIIDEFMPRGETFANPYIACEQCRERVVGMHDNLRNVPCGHKANWRSVCPSWSPVDGCCCQEHLGRVEHGLPLDRTAPGP